VSRTPSSGTKNRQSRQPGRAGSQSCNPDEGVRATPAKPPTKNAKTNSTTNGKTMKLILTLSIAAAMPLLAQTGTPSPFIVDHTTTDLFAPQLGIPQIKARLFHDHDQDGGAATAPVRVGDITIGYHNWGSFQQGTFQLNGDYNGNFQPGSWFWQKLGGSGPILQMELADGGTLKIFGNPNSGIQNSIILRTTGNVDGPAGVFVNGDKLVTQGDLNSDSSPLLQIQTQTLQVETALSVGQVAGIYGAGSMAAGQGALVYGANSLAFGQGATVGLSQTSYANNAAAIGNNARALAEGAMAIGKGSLASMKQSIAIGEDSEASGGTSIWWLSGYDWGSVAVGTKSKAAGIASAAFGNWATALGNESIALGPRAVVWSGASGGIALGWGTSATSPNATAIGNSAFALDVYASSFGTRAYGNHMGATAIGAYTDTNAVGQTVVGTAPDFAGLPESTNWTDENAAVFVVGSGAPGGYVGGTGGWSLSDFAVVRRTSFAVTRKGDVKAPGTVTAKGLTVENTADPTAVTTRLKGVILIERQGDISMGEFTAGDEP
jgi:hypothetical protein